MADLAKIADDLSNLTVLEAAELSKMLEEKWGVSAAAPVADVEIDHFLVEIGQLGRGIYPDIHVRMGANERRQAPC